MKKKVLSVLLVLCMMLSVVPMTTYAGDEPSIFASGDGASEATAYTIATLEQLEAFRDSVNGGEKYESKYVKLTSDIDMLTKYGDGKGEGGSNLSWTPIGSSFSNSFKGTFDGDGHYVNVYINNPGTTNQGLFGFLGIGATIKNVGVGGKICGGNFSGGIVALTTRDSLIEGCYNTAFISSSMDDIGGIVGHTFSSNFTIRNCYNAGTIIGNTDVGGIIGQISDSTTIENCYNFGSVIVTGAGAAAGAIVGFVSDLGTKTFNNCYYLNTSCQKGIGRGNYSTTALFAGAMKIQYSFGGFDFTDVWVMNESLGRPILRNNLEKGSDVNPYTISNLEELEYFRDSVNSYDNTYERKLIKLMADIDMSSKYGAGKASWTPISVFIGLEYDLDKKALIVRDGTKPFKGIFDGNGHKIDNIYVNGTADYQGLFAYIAEGATIKNLGVSGEINGGDNSGGIVGYSYSGAVENCYSTCNVSGGYSNSGGIVGYNYFGTVKNCYNAGAVSGRGNAGGITAFNNSKIEICYNVGKVSGTGKVGGIVGDNTGNSIFTETNVPGTATACYYLNTSCSTGIGQGSGTATALNLTEFKNQSKFSGFDFTNIWVMDNVFLGRPIFKANPEATIKGDGKTPATAFEIPDLPTLEVFRNTVKIGNDFADQFVKVTADIDMSTKYGAGKASWTPIAAYGEDATTSFKGTFDGGGHVIKVYINTTSDNQGLFCYVAEGGTIKNLGVDGEISGGGNAAGIVASNSGTIKDCYNKAKVSGSGFGYVGGIAAMVASGSSVAVDACYNTGTISSSNHAGGVVGYNNSEAMKNCFNTGEVTGKTSSGGIAAWNDKTIESCYNTGAISGVNESTNIGGIAGISQNASLTNCYYLDSSASKGIASGIGTATAKSAAEFASGEVAYLLQGTQTEQVWGQTLIGESKDIEPVYTGDWSKKVYKVSFLNVDGSIYKALYTNYNGTVTLPTEPTVDKGFKFDGWLIDDSESEFTATTVITQDITLRAQQTRNAFNVTYKDGMGGVIFADQSDLVTYGESTPAFKGDLTNVTSYSFDGWDQTIASTVTKDVVYTAKWKKKAANKLILNGNGGTVGTSATAESTTDEKSLVIGENTFTMAGYHFVAWNTLANGEGTAYNSGDSVNFTAIHNAETVTLYAQWEINSDYTVTFNYGEGLGTSRSGNIKWTDKVLGGITAPSNNGYDFGGWFCNGKEVTASTTYSELAANDAVKSITIEAKWTVKDGFTVIYNNPLVGMLSNTNVKWNDKVLNGITEQKKDGYRFDGWFCNNKNVTENTTYAELAVKDTVKSIELVAKWADIENPSISGIENGKTYCSAQTVTVADNGTIKSVTVNGVPAQLDSKLQFTLNPSKNEQVILVTDTDGNTATMTVTVNDGHTGGTATCCDKAECDICGTAYGALDPDNHTGTSSWIIDGEGHTQKWDCCDAGEEKEEHSFLWGYCEDCGYQHEWHVAFCICRIIWRLGRLIQSGISSVVGWIGSLF